MHKPFLIICLIAILINTACGNGFANQSEDIFFLPGLLQGKSFAITLNLGEEEFTDIITFAEDGSFTMASLSKIENSSGTYISVCGIVFFANFSGSFPENPFSFGFYGIYLSPNIFGIDAINFFGSKFFGTFSGTEI